MQTQQTPKNGSPSKGLINSMEEQKKKAEKQETHLPLETVDLIPKPPTGRAPQGIRTFTVCRQADESGVSGLGIVVEGVVFATGHCVVHWLTPAPRGALAIWDSIDDFIKVHIKPHPGNVTIITFQDGETLNFPE